VMTRKWPAPCAGAAGRGGPRLRPARARRSSRTPGPAGTDRRPRSRKKSRPSPSRSAQHARRSNKTAARHPIDAAALLGGRARILAPPARQGQASSVPRRWDLRWRAGASRPRGAGEAAAGGASIRALPPRRLPRSIGDGLLSVAAPRMLGRPGWAGRELLPLLRGRRSVPAGRACGWSVWAEPGASAVTTPRAPAHGAGPFARHHAPRPPDLRAKALARAAVLNPRRHRSPGGVGARAACALARPARRGAGLVDLA